MESPSKVKVDIMGHTYTIRGDAPPEHILKLSEYVNRKMEEVSMANARCNPTQVAILVALNIADEYFQVRDLKSGEDNAIEKKTEALISLLDEGLIGDIYSRVHSLSRQ